MSVGESNITWARREQYDLRPYEKGTVTVPRLDGRHNYWLSAKLRLVLDHSSECAGRRRSDLRGQR